jgi:molecular chaperone Hsp33
MKNAMNRYGVTGIVEMSYTSGAKNMENYFKKSEQLPTYIQLFLLFDTDNNVMLSRGVMLQLLPGETTSIISDFNSVITRNKSLFRNPDNKIGVDIWNKLLNSNYNYMSQKAVQYHCNCAKEQYYGIIFSLSPTEIDKIIKSKQTLEATCSCLRQKQWRA